MSLRGRRWNRWLNVEADVSDLLASNCGDIYRFEPAA
jgi:hypothetical protein